MLYHMPLLIAETGGGIIQTHYIPEIQEFLNMMFIKTWQMFQITYPGTDLSIGSIFIGFSLAGVAINVLKILFGFGAATSYRSMTTKNARISKERKGDEK